MPHGDHMEEDINHSQPPHQKRSATHYVIILVIVIVALYSIVALSNFIKTGIDEGRRANQRENIKQNLKQIGIALQNYQSQGQHQQSEILPQNPKAPGEN